MAEKSKIRVSFGCFGYLITLISIITFCAIFSLFLGSGEFYNESIKKVDAIINCDTIPVTNDNN